jgi:hypothetical protein
MRLVFKGLRSYFLPSWAQYIPPVVKRLSSGRATMLQRALHHQTALI